MLTPILIMTLRTSIPPRGHIGGHDSVGVPYMIFAPAENAFILHLYGGPQAMHADPTVIGHLMRAERLEPGFVRRILSPLTDCETASLAPDDRSAREARRAAAAASARQLAAEADHARNRRAAVIDVSRLDLEDL